MTNKIDQIGPCAIARMQLVVKYPSAGQLIFRNNLILTLAPSVTINEL
ncbi:MAG TPA: hypothetical protein V6D09_12065 [Leptolyngbyaceae cyanobacterium]